MKAYGNLWGTITSKENIPLAHQRAKRHKQRYAEVQMIDEDNQNGGEMLEQLRQDLINHVFHTSEYKRKRRKEGNKVRDIYILPYYPDRIAQWAVIQVIEPILIKTLIQDTYSAIPERGIHPGLNRLHQWMNKDIRGTQYCLKIDVKHYYPSINHEILKDKFRRLFKDPDLLWFVDEVINSIETATPEDRERLKRLKPLNREVLQKPIRGRRETPEEREKRYCESGIGIPIGNYFSQYSGNLYFSEFDHWIKEDQHCCYYSRHMDDINIFAETKEELHALCEKINDYFQTRLRITLKDNYQIFPTYARGLDYLGYRSFMGYTLLRKSTCKAMKKKMLAIRKKVDSGKEINYSEYCSINSYMGWLKHCDHFRLYSKYIAPLEEAESAYYKKYLQNGGTAKKG